MHQQTRDFHERAVRPQLDRVERRRPVGSASSQVVWTLNSPDCDDRLVRRRGWSPAAYETGLVVWLVALLG